MTRSLNPRRVAACLEGSAVGVALWSLLLTLQVLPGTTADTTGLGLFAAAGVVAGAAGLRRVLLGALFAGAAILAVVALTPLSDWLATRWIRDDPLPASGVGAVVVTSGGLNPDTSISSDALDRLLSGLELSQHLPAPTLITTTVRTNFPNGVVSSETDQSRIIGLVGRGIRWVRVPGGNSTRDEAVAVRKLLVHDAVRNLAVVTSPMHTRRACATFAAMGFLVTCVPARMREPGGLPLSPTPRDRLAVFGQWVYEIAATAKYRRHGWLDPSARD